ncbi:hypothetical protein [Verrucomicrobium spinosum]|uniref:hypothetical protein n=1 Tax=Verrucomicrobium spinosum TaxID=2736 RepID=UPI00017452B4|nr:hypothetical protein [Verrucomicrobium spinosum]
MDQPATIPEAITDELFVSLLVANQPRVYRFLMTLVPLREGVEFAGGSVIVRLAADGGLGWPLKGSAEDVAVARRKGTAPLPLKVRRLNTSELRLNASSPAR